MGCYWHCIDLMVLPEKIKIPLIMSHIWIRNSFKLGEICFLYLGFRYGYLFIYLFWTENRQGGVCREFLADQHAVDEAARLRHGLLVQRKTEGSFPRARGKITRHHVPWGDPGEEATPARVWWSEFHLEAQPFCKVLHATLACPLGGTVARPTPQWTELQRRRRGDRWCLWSVYVATVSLHC